MAERIRVLIADDSMLTRLVLRDLLCRDPAIEVVGEVRDGRAALEETRRLRPDLVIMDIMMPVMDGLRAVIEIMAHCPTPILVLSTNVDPRDSRSAFNAIRHGALDVMEKPQGLATEGFGETAGTLIEKVKVLSRVRVMHHFRRRQPDPAPASCIAPIHAPRDVLAIGASTGGPKAVMRLMRELPKEISAAVLIVQHITSGFAEGFAEWLNRESAFHVRMARQGDKIESGTALVAPSHVHMEVRDDRVVLSETPPVNCCRPSVDVLFRSLANPAMARRVVAVLLTGMGRDGAEGMAGLKRAGGLNIAQDESTSTVFGMPRAAIDLGAVHQVLPLCDIAPAIGALLQPGTRRGTSKKD